MIYLRIFDDHSYIVHNAPQVVFSGEKIANNSLKKF